MEQQVEHQKRCTCCMSIKTILGGLTILLSVIILTLTAIKFVIVLSSQDPATNTQTSSEIDKAIGILEKLKGTVSIQLRHTNQSQWMNS